MLFLLGEGRMVVLEVGEEDGGREKRSGQEKVLRCSTGSSRLVSGTGLGLLEVFVGNA